MERFIVVGGASFEGTSGMVLLKLMFVFVLIVLV